MADPLAAAPKVELHLHLEGAIPLDLLWDLVNKHGGDPAVPSRRALIDHLRYTSFPDFIDTWVWMTGFIRSYDDFTRLAEDVAAGLARQNIVYAEASFSPTDFARHDLTPQGIATAIRRGLAQVPETQVVLNCDLVRDTGPERAQKTLSAIAEVRDAADIRGITIGGSEHAYPPKLFAAVYRQAQEIGFRLTAHAGEAAGPDSVRSAIDDLQIERIGHGVRCVEDPVLLDRIVTEQIPLEVCPTSNLRTGVTHSWDEHPVGTLLSKGALITVSSDDPTFFHTSVADDLRELATRFDADPRQLTKNAIAASWMTGDEKARVSSVVEEWWSARDD